MAVKYIKHTVTGEFDCSGCDCKDAYLCIDPASYDMLVGNAEAIPARIDSCETTYHKVSELAEESLCGDKIVKEITNVIMPRTEITFRYDADLLVDPEYPLSDGDVICISTDACTVKAAIELANAGASQVDSVNGAIGVVVLDADDIDDSATAHKFVTAGDLTTLSNTSGTNTGDVTVTDSSEIDFTLTGQDITASLVAGSIDETKLDASTNASLDLADSALQSGDNVSELTNDSGFITASSTSTLTNKSGNISQWTNNSGYITSAPVTSVAGKTGVVTLDASDITDFDTEVANNSAVTANTAKVTNATHTGEVTGSGALTVDKTVITNKTFTAPSAGDSFVFSDVSDSSNLKAATLNQIGTGITDSFPQGSWTLSPTPTGGGSFNSVTGLSVNYWTIGDLCIFVAAFSATISGTVIGFTFNLPVTANDSAGDDSRRFPINVFSTAKDDAFTGFGSSTIEGTVRIGSGATDFGESAIPRVFYLSGMYKKA